MKVEQTGV